MLQAALDSSNALFAALNIQTRDRELQQDINTTSPLSNATEGLSDD